MRGMVGGVCAWDSRDCSVVAVAVAAMLEEGGVIIHLRRHRFCIAVNRREFKYLSSLMKEGLIREFSYLSERID